MKQTINLFRNGLSIRQESFEMTPKEYIELQHLYSLDLVIKQKELLQVILNVGVNN